MNLRTVIEKLQHERQIFHSEDDLKFALAVCIKELYATLELRLEVPLNIVMKSINSGEQSFRAIVDIVVLDYENRKAYPIEIKYKTKCLHTSYDNENYELRNHGALDVGRYSFRKDIYRLENVESKDFDIEKGYLLILTNDKSYVNDNTNQKRNVDRHFSFHDGAEISREYLGWNYEHTDPTKYYTDLTIPLAPPLRRHWTLSKELSYKLDLKKNYQIFWRNYSTISGGNKNANEFYYCLIEVER
ncbi:hypothetical protein M8998_03770 [Sphingobacterium sp. lm-10]|uniref:hypothetical protein n=1 Tax=Sphingobacterium sp. lm-10 TaxID=2944904 RepID=UPI0020213441|nr:hypothetical protein [Sphingobacterium sp. lm-10]MCL7987056.1 hypothetical protein [Sphingobacterium sp. lm-10]